MTATQITDHAEQALETQSDWVKDKDRLRKLCEILADEVQLTEDVIFQVLVNSLLENATGVILDEYGNIFDHLRGSLGDDDYRKALSAVMAAHQSDGTAKEVIYLASTLIGVAVKYQVYPLAHYRLEYEIGTPISADWETRVLQILEIARPAGVSYALVEGSTAGDGAFQFDVGPGFDQGRFARRVI
jgi:hypothetical protein